MISNDSIRIKLLTPEDKVKIVGEMQLHSLVCTLTVLDTKSSESRAFCWCILRR